MVAPWRENKQTNHKTTHTHTHKQKQNKTHTKKTQKTHDNNNKYKVTKSVHYIMRAPLPASIFPPAPISKGKQTWLHPEDKNKYFCSITTIPNLKIEVLCDFQYFQGSFTYSLLLDSDSYLLQCQYSAFRFLHWVHIHDHLAHYSASVC